jgi:formate C-acetyltransferase
MMQQMRTGKTLEDAREGGCSGCIETGAFGKEAYILTGYLNVPKILELTLNNGTDPLTGKQVGLQTAEPTRFEDFDALYDAFASQLNYIVGLKIRLNNYIERMYAKYAPAPFLSVVIADCIANAKDYNSGGPRYNTNYIQCCGIGTVTDSLSAIKQHVFENKTVSIDDLCNAIQRNFADQEALRLRLLNKTPCYGNDDDHADAIMQRVYASLFDAIDGKPNTKGTTYHLNMLSTTCHVYFGKMLGASANGRFAGLPISDGTSPSHGADRNGPTAVIKSLAKMDQVKSGGTLLNQRFLPDVLAGAEGIEKLCHLIRTYFKLNGHHIQFNIVDSQTLRQAQRKPDEHRDLLVRVAGYSDYFVDLDADHQDWMRIIRKRSSPEPSTIPSKKPIFYPKKPVFCPIAALRIVARCLCRGKMPLPHVFCLRRTTELRWLKTRVGVASSHEMYAPLLLLCAPFEHLKYIKSRREIPHFAGAIVQNTGFLTLYVF